MTRSQTASDAPTHALPPALAGSLGFLLAKSAERVRERFNARLLPHAVTARQVGVLEVARAFAGGTQQEIADTLHVDRTTMMKLIDDLEALGAVERTATRDRRSNVIVITSKGNLLRDRAFAEARRVEREVLQPFSRQDRATLHRVLGALAARA